MAVKESLKIDDQNLKKAAECKKCIWGKKLIDDKEYDVLNIMCMFNKCIKHKKDK